MSKPFITNSKAHFNYEILDTFEAGLVLLGSEVKSLRAGHASLLDSFIILQDGELFLTKCYIKKYQFKGSGNIDEYRKRKILVKKSEINEFIKHKKEAGLTLIPLSVYDKHGKLKLSFALARGKKLHDKRETIKRRDANREMHRAMKERI